MKLTERLAQNLEAQRIEAEALMSAELKALGKNLRRDAQHEQQLTLSAIQETSEQIENAMSRMKGFLRSWWIVLGAIVFLWVILMGLQVSGAFSPRPSMGAWDVVKIGEQPYLLLPDGSQMTQCTETRTGRVFPCVTLPKED